MTPQRSTMFELADRIMGGTLAEIVAGWRAEGLGTRQIAERLKTEFDVDVAHSTVARWIKAGHLSVSREPADGLDESADGEALSA